MRTGVIYTNTATVWGNSNDSFVEAGTESIVAIGSTPRAAANWLAPRSASMMDWAGSLLRLNPLACVTSS